MQELNTVIINSAISILTVLIAVATNSLRVWLNKKGGLTAIRILEILTNHAVQATEQIYKDKDIHGKVKFQQAKDIVLQGLAQQGLVISDLQINTAIESAVKALNDGWNKQ